VLTGDPVVETYFSRLGRAFSSRWSAQGRTVEGLPEVAEKTLLEFEVPPGLTARSILAYASRCADLPDQWPNDNFGEPPLILYHEDDFIIQALIWMKGSTAIHDHGFSGAFMVADGSSLHVKQDFDRIGALGDDRLLFGRLLSRSPELLRPNCVQRIDPGRGFIHALFHLSVPTATIVIRDVETFGVQQFTYLRPGLAYQQWWEDQRFTRRMQSLDSLRRTDPAAAWAVSSELVADSPCWEAFQVVLHAATMTRYGLESQDLLALFVQKYSDVNRLLPLCMQTLELQRKILIRRGMLTDLHHRLFLALLANLPQPADTIAVIDQLFPGREPTDMLLDWAEELAAPQLRGISGINISSKRLVELRSLPVESRAQLLLDEVRAEWGDPLTDLREKLYG
jgi:hypothetical protein